MRVRFHPNVLFHSFGSEGVLLDPQSEVFLRLNETAVRMWELLQDHESTDDVVDALEAEFEVSRGDLDDDLEAFIAELESRNLAAIDATGA